MVPTPVIDPKEAAPISAARKDLVGIRRALGDACTGQSGAETLFAGTYRTALGAGTKPSLEAAPRAAPPMSDGVPASSAEAACPGLGAAVTASTRPARDDRGGARPLRSAQGLESRLTRRWRRGARRGAYDSGHVARGGRAMSSIRMPFVDALAAAVVAPGGLLKLVEAQPHVMVACPVSRGPQSNGASVLRRERRLAARSRRQRIVGPGHCRGPRHRRHEGPFLEPDARLIGRIFRSII